MLLNFEEIVKRRVIAQRPAPRFRMQTPREPTLDPRNGIDRDLGRAAFVIGAFCLCWLPLDAELGKCLACCAQKSVWAVKQGLPVFLETTARL